ncbi:hypothetical protein GCM10010196_26430 [Agromyces mediolanus]|uniref:DUF6993 domain-containing protein n=2 Tax=Agromyces mediolanus TaxID=41986 RepID=A0A918CMR6_AGRME|nr:hypothetical protein GCM10010196_26430 [Agromyces mediolanus]GLJ72439.1 hypothetical protein GCM10017583_16950 [Agromyces mediolanus]
MPQRGRAVAASMIAVTLLVGCTSTVAPPSASTPVSAPPPSPSATPRALDLSTPPTRNLETFDALAHGVIERDGPPTTSDFVDALRTAGAPDERLEFGDDLTTEGKPADAYFWAVRFDDGCLVGQFRPLETDPDRQYLSAEAPLVGGRCLVAPPSETRNRPDKVAP